MKWCKEKVWIILNYEDSEVGHRWNAFLAWVHLRVYTTEGIYEDAVKRCDWFIVWIGKYQCCESWFAPSIPLHAVWSCIERSLSTTGINVFVGCTYISREYALLSIFIFAINIWVAYLEIERSFPYTCWAAGPIHNLIRFHIIMMEHFWTI